MRRGLRFLAVSVPILICLAINIVLAAPSKKAANIETRPSQTRPGGDTSGHCEAFCSLVRSAKPLSTKCQEQTFTLAAVYPKSDRMF